MKVIVRKSAMKDMRSISEPYKSKIKEKIAQLAEYKTLSEVKQIKKLKNHTPVYRMRVGEYRVLFDHVDPNAIEIAAIKHRKEAY